MQTKKMTYLVRVYQDQFDILKAYADDNLMPMVSVVSRLIRDHLKD